jgi:hypothetical protein
VVGDGKMKYITSYTTERERRERGSEGGREREGHMSVYTGRTKGRTDGRTKAKRTFHVD